VQISSGKSEAITITNAGDRLSRDEIERMLSEAEEFASEDQAQREKAVALNSLSSLVYDIKAQLSDQHGLGGKISAKEKTTITDAVREVEYWIDENASTASLIDLEANLAGTFDYDLVVYAKC
jgi:endoplasmic reticulum chaperone BiP